MPETRNPYATLALVKWPRRLWWSSRGPHDDTRRIRTTRSPSVILAALALCTCHASGQITTNAPAATNSPPPAIEDNTKKWSFSASVYTYLVPDSRDYVQ